jgi:PmbA protein
MPSIDLISTAERIMKISSGEGAEQVEVYVESRENLVMRLQKISGRDNFTTRDQLMVGAAIRVLKGGASGFAYLSSIDDESVKSSARSALKVAEPQAGLESFHAKSSSYPKVTGSFDKDTAEMNPDHVMSHLEAIKKGVAKVDDKHVTVYDALFGRSKHAFAVVNTQGLRVEDYGSFARMAIGISAKDGEKSAKQELANVMRSVKNTAVTENFGSESTRRVLRALGTQNIMPKKMTAVLAPASVGEIFTYSFTNAFCADNVQHKASVLEGRIGQQIAAPVVTLVDDGTFDGGLTSFKMDDEGMPTKRTILVEKGILKNYLHDNQTSQIAATESTGNCVRWELPTVDYFFYRSYRRLPRVYPTNIVFQPGSTTNDKIIAEVKDGIFVDRTDPAFTATPDGSFSVVVLNGVRIENGELTTPVRDLRIAGNVFDYAKKIDAIGNTAEKYCVQLYPACVITPYIRVQDVSIQT